MALPLRINGLAMKHFLAHESTELDLETGGIVWITGNTGEGKSSVRDAIEYALLATARGLKRGDAEALVYDPTVRGLPAEEKPRRMGVMVRALIGAKVHEIKRTRSSESHAKAHLAALLGVPDLDVLEAVLDAGSFVRLDRESRLRLIDRVLGHPITEDELLKAGIDDPEIRVAAMRSVKSALSKATERRRAIERDLPKDLPEAPADPMLEGLNKRASEIVPEALKPNIDAATLKRNALAGDIERLKGMGEGKVAALEAVLEERRAALPAKEEAVLVASKALSSLATGPKATEAQEAAAFLVQLRATTTEDGDALIQAKAMVQAAEEAAAGRKQDLLRAEKQKDGPCPTCTHPMTAAALVALRKSQIAHAEAALATAKALRDTRALTCRKTEDDEARIQTIIDAHAGALQDARDAEGEAKEALDDAQNEIRDGERAVADAKAAVADPAVIASKAEALAKMDARIAAASAAYDTASAYRSALKAYEVTTGSLSKSRAEADRYRRYETILGETGILATRTAGGIALLQQKVGEFSARVCPPGTSVALDDAGELLYCGKPWERASEGEAWIAAAMVAAALSNLSGLKFLFLDSMSALDPEARDRMFKLLAPLVRAGDLVQVFVVTLKDRVGYCEACQGKSIREANGCCRLHPEFPVTVLRPVGSMVGFVRIFGFTKPGEMHEVLAVSVAEEGAAA